MTRTSAAAAFTIACAAMLAGTAAGQEPFVERVDVTRVLIDARVFDPGGRPIRDLEASDFTVTIGRRPARVESAQWVGSRTVDDTLSSSSVRTNVPPAETSAAPTRGTEASGRLVVFLAQRDLEPRRITGFMRVAPLVDRLLGELAPGDRAAVLSFDSRLRFWTDLTTDLERVRTLLSREVISGRPGPVSAAADVSLMARLSPERAARTWGIEHAMRVVAEALEPLPGAKSLVLLGYGFGRFDARSEGVLLMDGYREASVALQRARVAVFTLNVTQADHNSLEAGLQSVAADTGGTYASTFRFPELAVERVASALTGHYVLFVEAPELRPGTHAIEVRLARTRGTVLARRTYRVDRPSP